MRRAGAVVGRIAEVSRRLTRLQDPTLTSYLGDLEMLDLEVETRRR